jgi:hypothetical protein
VTAARPSGSGSSGSTERQAQRMAIGSPRSGAESALGHDPRLMPARYVRPYSKGPKNDFRDAEAVLRPSMKFVAHQNG